MRGLIFLTVVLGLALPAFGTEVPAPVAEADAPEQVATPSEPAGSETAPAAEPAIVEAEPARPPVSADAVARATFATAIDQREPVDSINSLESDRSRVYYFTEFVGVSGRELTHRWEHDGVVVAEVPIAIGGPRWRAYSSKGLDASQLGEWTVSVVDESGDVVRKDSFVYEAAAPEPEIAAPASTPAEPAVGKAPEAPDAPPASPPPASPAPASPVPAQP